MTGADVEHTKALAAKFDPAAPSQYLAKLGREVVAAVGRVQAIAEHWSTCPKGDYDCSECNYNRPEAGDLLLEALNLETPK
ncbi:hypothetical protein LRQ08_21640 [Rhodococcus qingshengii]|uniref:hypothetical protein n=1 Tax=Rhodococcus qingshengii TaxID=334542 RepID=UPI002112F211|nr:hypothetical protein [Rhodococcus qingshengii]UUE23832.1 hypothetical protein LRQ08_21640 [Rhodococcus qingshengii]